jgi:hypothetical protein
MTYQKTAVLIFMAVTPSNPPHDAFFLSVVTVPTIN